MKRHPRTLAAALAAVLPMLLIAGCGSREEARRSNPPPINVDKQIQEIQANPHMPQQAKDAAIATIRQQQASAAARGTKK